MNNDPSSDFLDDATAGLKDDPELRLDVRQELLSHIEDAEEELRAKGHSPKESRSLALKAMGPPLDIANDLAAANRNRMRTRALVRIAMRALPIPMAIAVAVLLVMDAVYQLRTFSVIGLLGGVNCTFIGDQQTHKAVSRERISDHAKLLIWSGDSPDSRLNAARSILRADPDDLVFLGNYVTALLAATSTPDIQAELDAALRRGVEIDPDNARYNYMQASLLLDDACTVEWDESAKLKYRFTVKDRAKLDLAMQKVLDGGSRPLFRTCASNMLRRQLEALPPARRIDEQLGRIALAAGVLLPDIARCRKISRACPLYAKLLIEEDHVDAALPFLNAWQPLSTQLTRDSFTLIEILVAAAVAGTAETLSVPILESAGRADLAADMKRRADTIRAPTQAWRQRWNAVGDDRTAAEEIRMHASMLQRILMPVLGEPVSDDDLRPGRMIEHIMLERASLTVFIAIFLLMLLGCGVVFLRWRSVRGAASAPLLLLPDLPTLARTIGLSVVVPVAVYFAYTRFTPFSGREFALQYAAPRFLLELLLLEVIILHCSISMTSRWIRKRCSELAIDMPASSGTEPFLALWIPAGLLAVSLGILWRVAHINHDPGHAVAVVLAVVMCAAVGIIVTAPFIILFRLLRGGRQYGLYVGTLARSLMPVFAAVVIVVGAVGHPYLALAETHWLQQERLISDSEYPGIGFTALEIRLVSRLRSETLEAMQHVDRNGGRTQPSTINH